LEWIVFGVQSVDTVGRCTTSSYLLAGPACVCDALIWMVEDLHARFTERSVHQWMKASSFRVWHNVLLKCKEYKIFGVHLFFPLRLLQMGGSCKGNSLHSHANSPLGTL